MTSCANKPAPKEVVKADPEPLSQTQLCMGTHAHIALSNSKYFDVIKLLDDKGRPVKCEVKKDDKVAKKVEKKKDAKK